MSENCSEQLLVIEYPGPHSEYNFVFCVLINDNHSWKECPYANRLSPYVYHI